MQTTAETPVTPSAPRHVQVLIFDDVEVLDFAGPFEVFGVTGLRTGPAPFRVETVGLSKAPIRARNGLEVRVRIQESQTFDRPMPRPARSLVPLTGLDSRPAFPSPPTVHCRSSCSPQP